MHHVPWLVAAACAVAAAAAAAAMRLLGPGKQQLSLARMQAGERQRRQICCCGSGGGGGGGGGCRSQRTGRALAVGVLHGVLAIALLVAAGRQNMPWPLRAGYSSAPPAAPTATLVRMADPDASTVGAAYPARWAVELAAWLEGSRSVRAAAAVASGRAERGVDLLVRDFVKSAGRGGGGAGGARHSAPPRSYLHVPSSVQHVGLKTTSSAKEWARVNEGGSHFINFKDSSTFEAAFHSGAAGIP
jgi:hypothetical protein